MLSMLIAYDENGNVVATLAHMIAKDEDDNVVGLVDFEAHERGGGRLRDIWMVDKAVGSASWPEWINMKAHEFRVELDSMKRIKALIHKTSEFRRERASIESAIAERIASAKGHPADIRDLVGGPNRPLRLDDQGRTVPRRLRQRPQLPMIAKGRESRPKES